MGSVAGRRVIKHVIYFKIYIFADINLVRICIDSHPVFRRI